VANPLFTVSFWLVMLGYVTIAAVGLIDDVKQIGPLPKYLGQFLAALIAILARGDFSATRSAIDRADRFYQFRVSWQLHWNGADRGLADRIQQYLQFYGRHRRTCGGKRCDPGLALFLLSIRQAGIGRAGHHIVRSVEPDAGGGLSRLSCSTIFHLHGSLWAMSEAFSQAMFWLPLPF
jgi:hypothetical protein